MTATTNVVEFRQQALANHVGALRATLDEQRAFRAEQLAELATAAGPGASADAATADEVNAVLTDGATRALKEIDAAIARIEDGTYGACQQCGGAIPGERLEVLPMTALCVRCASRRDQRAK